MKKEGWLGEASPRDVRPSRGGRRSGPLLIGDDTAYVAPGVRTSKVDAETINNNNNNLTATNKHKYGQIQ